jgi:hypothetical protein
MEDITKILLSTSGTVLLIFSGWVIRSILRQDKEIAGIRLEVAQTYATNKAIDELRHTQNETNNLLHQLIGEVRGSMRKD